MTSLEHIENFDEMQLIARKIDEGINYLDRKLAHVKNLGLSLDPEKTKKEAEDILQEYEIEIEEMKSNLESSIKSQEIVLEDFINDNQQMSVFIEQIENELLEIESKLQNEAQYIRYVPESMNISQNNQEVNIDMDEMNCTDNHPNPNSFVEPQNTTQKMETPKLSRCYKEYPSICETTNRTVNEYTNNSVAMSENKLNCTNDLVRTPVDPGVSFLTMQLLGKSNVKTKVYKVATSSISSLNKSLDTENLC